MKLFVLLLSLFTTTLAQAQGFLMWQAQKEDRLIHVLAVVPFISSNVVSDLGAEIDQAFVASKVMVFESDLDPERRKSAHQRILEAALYAESDSLLNHLSDPVGKQYRATCRKLTIENDNLNRMRPWMAAQNLLRIALAQAKVRLGDDLNAIFFRRSVSEDKPLAFLNNPQTTIDLYGAMTEQEQERVLEKALRDCGNLTNFLSAVETAWRASDVEAATRLMNESFAGFEDVHQKLFAARNDGWAGDLDAQAAIEGEIMALIGLSHLVGAESLLERLKARGYLIAQVVPE